MWEEEEREPLARGDSWALPEDAHGSSHECFATVLVLPDQVQELKDGLDERLQERLYIQVSVSPFHHFMAWWPTLAGRSHRQHDSTPGIHDALTERDDIVEHLVWTLRRGRDVGRLLQHLRDDREVDLEVSTDGLSEVPEALKDGRFKLIAQGSTLVRMPRSVADDIKQRPHHQASRRKFSKKS